MGRLRRKQRQSDLSAARSGKAAESRQAERNNPVAEQQRAIGNQAVQRLVDSRTIQPKLTVAPPSDAYEQEADRVANSVMGQSRQPEAAGAGQSPATIHRLGEEVHRAPAKADDDKKKEGAKGGEKAGGKEGAKGAEKSGKEGDKKAGGKEEPKKKDEDKVKRKAAVMDEEDKREKEEDVMQRLSEDTEVPEVVPELERDLDRIAGGGQPLPQELQSFFEPRFGHDLSDVRIHTDAEAAAAAHELKALAFTRGEHIFFSQDAYDPQSDQGKWLLAHELTHTVQQKTDSVEAQEPSSDLLASPRREDDERFGPSFPIASGPRPEGSAKAAAKEFTATKDGQRGK